jgi:glycosyltransferase involved in cell wall biosynthesis
MIPLIVDLETEWRGGQNQALLTAKGMLACGHDAQLVAIRDSPLARRAAQAGIEVHDVAARAKRSRAALVLRKLLSQKTFDVVHANEPHALTAAWLAGAHRKVPVVVSRRVAYPLQNNAIARTRYLMAKRILAVSRFVAASVVESGIPADKVEVVYEGVEVPPAITREAHERARQRWSVADKEKLLGCVGYLLPEKGQESVLRAMPAVCAKFPGTRLLLAGDGPCRARLEGLAKQLDLEDAIIFAGFVEDVAQVYAALNIFVFPSLAEPLGTSLLAAMAWGLPVLAVASGGVPEYVQNGENGLLVAESNPEPVADGLLRLLTNDSQRAELGRNARQTIENKFSARRMVENTLSAYKKVSDGRLPLSAAKS